MGHHWYQRRASFQVQSFTLWNASHRIIVIRTESRASREERSHRQNRTRPLPRPHRNLMLDQWEYRHNPQQPIVDLENCVDLFVQSLDLDVDDLMEDQEPVQYPSNRRSRNQLEGSVVGVLDKEQLLAALDEQMEQYPGMTEEAFNQAIEVAHGEDISA